MLGIVRPGLASLVVTAHIGMIGGFRAGYAVFSFYLMSGWLMTVVINKGYAGGMGGFLLYCLNRFLRIFPLYWLGLFLSIGILTCFGSSVTDFHAAIRWPEAGGDVFKNVFIVGLDPEGDGARLIPPAWVASLPIFAVSVAAVILNNFTVDHLRSRIRTIAQSTGPATRPIS